MKQGIEDALFEVLSRQGYPADDIANVRAAYEFAYRCHDGQLRKSDEPYIIHPVEVATVLARLDADSETLCAALLHDVLEDCDVKRSEIEKCFGTSILKIVEGVTKLGKFSFTSREERQAENFRKLIVAIAEDVRVVLVKLADRLHNMQTLSHMPPEKQREIAKETLEIYAPLAHRFGLAQMRWQLEDLSLKYLHPEDHAEIKQLMADTSAERHGIIEQVIVRLKEDVAERGIKAEIAGRPKSIYSIWKKMKRQIKPFEELYDVLAVRIIVDSTDEKNYCEIDKDPDTQKCYEVMGIVHNLFKPIPGRFKDYIAMPKANNYQSLHTTVLGPQGIRPVEIQIRTRRMHHIAEYGIAAHWRYKESGRSTRADSNADRKLSWLRQLVEWQKDLKDAREYLDTVKMDLFADEVFVFSPRGDVFDLPTGSTPIDFAYRIHTEVGHQTTGARVNDRIVPLTTRLRSGDIIEIITAKNARPRMDWLNIAKTQGAKNKIRQWFKKHHREDHILKGRQMLEAELGRQTLDEFLRCEKVADFGKRYNITEPEDILAAVGYGDISTAQVVNRAREQAEPERKRPSQPADEKASTIGSLGGLMHHIAKCCQPVPGEEIAGVVTRGSGIAVHRADCSNLLKVESERHMAVDWSEDRQSKYPAALKVECLDRVGIAGDILKKISDSNINLKDVRVETQRDANAATIYLVVEIADIVELTRVAQAISRISDVVRVQRQNHRKRRGEHSSNVTPLIERSSNRKKRARSSE